MVANLFFVILILIVLLSLSMKRAPILIWSITLGLLLLFWQVGLLHGDLQSPLRNSGSLLLWVPIIILFCLSIEKFRRQFLVNPAYKYVKNILPKVSETEQQALEAGTVGFDAEIFSGKPNWDKLRSVSTNTLSSEELAFLNGPTEQLCSLIDDWDIRNRQRDIPEHIWKFVKENGFLGMLISKEHGGLGFSAQAQSLILGKIASRSPDVVTIIMVPNSLGPGELIEKYGTTEQKKHYLPRLASGKEIPCFSLTGPSSGSDAATMLDIGIIKKGQHEGKEIIGISLTWEKRYITLGPKATLVGLAFRLFDPMKLLGQKEDVGITLALIPSTHLGVNIGRRHLPSGAAFPNGPNWGKDVFIPIDWVIGGEKKVGQGWRMLMECLAAGRAISLPSSATAGSKMLLRVTTAYARIRTQFGIPIGKMEGVDEVLARIVEIAYLNEAARAVTAGMVSRGERPSVLSALMKYQTTERLRQSVNHAMDIHGGKAICDGPQNYLRSAFEMVPIGITVEGANILTRSLITFAQGALRSHPHLYNEIKAVQNIDNYIGLAEFENEFLEHISDIVCNISTAFIHNLTFGIFASAPEDAEILKPYYRQLSRGSSNFAVLSDFIIATLGGALKVKQKISGRMADALSELYFGACILKRYEDEGYPKDDLPILQMTFENCLERFENSLHEVIRNIPNIAVRLFLKFILFPFGRRSHKASDQLESQIASLVLKPGPLRDRLTSNIYIPKKETDPVCVLEETLKKVIQTEDLEKKIQRAIRQGQVKHFHGLDWIHEAQSKGIISEHETHLLREVVALTSKVIAVDHFDPREIRPHYELINDRSW
ncbi:MAG: acyl-CoA dehydrogenase [Hyphomicrobium sp.]